MPFSTSVVGVITAMASLFTAVSLVIAAVAGLMRSRKVEAKVNEVHLIVNQQRTDMQRYERALKAALIAAGVDIPVDQSIEDKP